MYVYIYIFSDLLRKRDSFLRVFNLKKGSIRSYKGAWERFREFHVGTYGTEASVPVTMEAVSIYLTNLGVESKSMSVINTASAAITMEHEVKGFQSPCTEPMIARLKKAIRRKNAGTKVSMARRPFTNEESAWGRGKHETTNEDDCWLSFR